MTQRNGNTIMIDTKSTPTSDQDKPRKRWSRKTIIEIIPIVMALTALLTFGVAKNVTDVELLTPLTRVVTTLPLWGTVLMALVMAIGVTGIILGIYIFSRAPVSPDGSDEG